MFALDGAVGVVNELIDVFVESMRAEPVILFNRATDVPKRAGELALRAAILRDSGVRMGVMRTGTRGGLLGLSGVGENMTSAWPSPRSERTSCARRSRVAEDIGVGMPYCDIVKEL